MEIVFQAAAPWALLPFPARPDTDAKTAESAAYAEGFRWLRRSPSSSRDSSRPLDAEVGWLVPSPVDIRVAPFQDVEVAVSEAERAAFCRTMGLQERDFWRPNPKTFLVNDGAAWMNVSSVDFKEDWRTLFYSLGEGFIEFRMGWTVRVPSNYYVMLAPLAGQEALPDLEVVSGILAAKTLKRLSKDLGIAVAFRPRRPLLIRRHQPIARLLLLHVDSLRAKGKFLARADEE